MIKIAVCDDDPLDMEDIRELINTYNSDKTYAVNSYSDSQQFLSVCTSTSFDIVLLDIEMAAPTGYELGRILKARENPPVIIFITKSSKYVLKGYGIAFRYLMKPVQYAEFAEAMDAAVEEINSNRLSFTCENGMLNVPMKDILYIESYGHSVTIHTTSCDYSMRYSLAEIAGELPRSTFVSPHKGYLVNLRHIQYASSAEIRLTGGTSLPVSRRKRTEFNTALNNYLGR